MRNSELEELSALHPVVPLIVQYRQLRQVSALCVEPFVRLSQTADIPFAVSGVYDTNSATGVYEYCNESGFTISLRVYGTSDNE